MLGDEGHCRMQQAQDDAQDMGGGGAHLGGVRVGGAVQDRLGELQEPVAERVPGEAVVGLRHRGIGGVEQPAAQRQAGGGRVEAGGRGDAVHLAEAGGVP